MKYADTTKLKQEIRDACNTVLECIENIPEIVSKDTESTIDDWIDVNDRTPDIKHTEYLVCTLEPYPYGGEIRRNIRIARFEKTNWSIIEAIVTHWMPLPQLPDNAKLK